MALKELFPISDTGLRDQSLPKHKSTIVEEKINQNVSMREILKKIETTVGGGGTESSSQVLKIK